MWDINEYWYGGGVVLCLDVGAEYWAECYHILTPFQNVANMYLNPIHTVTVVNWVLFYC